MTDYLLLKDELLTAAIEELEAVGHVVERHR